jgi:hypothetical protein
MARLLQINACDRETGTLANCTFKLDRPIGGRYRLAGVQVPYVQPPVVNLRNSLLIKIGTSLRTISFTLPVYTPAQLVVELKARLDAAAAIGDSVVFTVVLDSQNHLVISRNTETNITFYARFPTSVSIIKLSQVLGTNDLGTELADTLGITSDIILTGVASTTFTFPNGINLASPLSYHIDINKDIQLETTTGSCATFAVPINVSSFDVISYKAREHVDQIVSFPDLTRVLTIKWTDNEGFDLERHQNWSMLLEKV